ncbi:Sigma-70 family RNA polymerase sigma factor [Sulfidibacter corallicola]|uniref:Sigma-70 family RNA polymerase sigma factor n=1 Tax=Sulfidibacter corallicola TaxID=2818388 RepID=A0A8A4TQL2_SULCO|nr:ECF-type sigma factor [Sulfidibacter corallicola]QTD51707.1 sigma-70 family RNA polymerase sigma factor [Sulfidibacter corallicola]
MERKPSSANAIYHPSDRSAGHPVQDPTDLQKQPITDILQNWHHCNSSALEQLIPLVYRDLRGMAGFYLRDSNQYRSLQPTELVHDVYLQLLGSKSLVFENRSHFFKCAALIMRQILVRYARLRGALKRGGTVKRVPFDEQLEVAFPGLEVDQLLTLDQLIQQLGALDPRKLQILEWRFFLGLETEEIGTLLSISPRTVQREWQSARGWLARELRRAIPGSSESEPDDGAL